MSAPADAQSPRTRADAALARHRRWIVLAIVVLSLLVRIGHLVEISDSPCGATERYANSDTRFFDVWARTIARGDWLGARPLHPLHDWHEQVAAIHFREQAGQATTNDREAARTLWNEWYGGTRFHQEPLYPYAIAVVYRLMGADPTVVYLLQMLLGVLSNLLIYFIARRNFSDTVAVVAAVMALGCGPLLFYEGALLRSSAITFLGLLAVHVTQRAFDGGSRGSYLLAGLCAGLATLLKSTLLLLGLGAMALVLWRERRRPRAALARAGLLAAGIAACLLPVAVRNAAVDAPVASLSSVAAVTFLGANFEGNDPSRGFQLPIDDTAAIMGRTEGRLAPTILATLRTHPHAGSWPALCARKLGVAWHYFEIPNNVNYYLCRQAGRVLRLLPVSFTWIAPLALAGIFAAAWTRRGTVMLYVLVLAHLLPLLVFYVLSRFRAPLLAATIPFAAAALVWLVESLIERRRQRAAILAALVLLAALWTAWPRSPESGPEIRLADVASAVRHWYLPESRRALAAGDAETASRLLEGSLRLEPPFIEEVLQGRRPVEPGDRDYLLAFAELHAEAARAMLRAGRKDEARRLRERGLELQRQSMRH